jgi:predicted acetyltransferase
MNTAFAQKAHGFLVLVPENDPLTDDILAHCEVYEHPLLVSTTPGEAQQAKCMGIGSVFCPVEHRGHGYASQMLKLLHQEFEKDTTIRASNLYSDIGSVFYDRLGWKTMPSKEIFIAAEPSLAVPDNVKTITSHEEIETLVAKDVELLHKEIKDSESAAVCILPTAEKIAWIQLRSNYYFEKLTSWTIDTLGAYIPGTDNYATFFYHYERKCIYFLRMRSDSEETTKAFLAVAQREALRFQFKKISIWDIPTLEDSHINQTVTEQRTSSISALATFNLPNEVTWLLNEKFAWI